ncbi:MAG: hypothetical protein U1E76_08705 [Planctomycetota bacterium]
MRSLVLARSALPPVVAEPSDGGLLLSMTAADADLVLLVQAARAFVEDPADAGKEPSLGAFVPGELPASVLLGGAALDGRDRAPSARGAARCGGCWSTHAGAGAGDGGSRPRA